MNSEIIKEGEKILALIFRNDNFKEGLDFLTKESDALQVGTWNYSKGKILNAHGHKKAERKNNIVQELVFVKSGKIRADIYNDDKKLVAQRELTNGDFIILMNGGHSYGVLEDHTQILEVKNGPYLGLEKDKIIF